MQANLDLDKARFNMIEQQVRPWEVLDAHVLELLDTVRRASKRGITTRNSCVMIDAVMYGMMPSAKIESCSRAPPLKRLTSW